MDLYAGLPEWGGPFVLETDDEGILREILGDDDEKAVIGVGGDADAAALAEGVAVEAAVLAAGASIGIEDRAGLVGNVGFKEIVDADTSDKADALGILLLGVGEADLARALAHLWFAEVTDGEQCALQLAAGNEAEKVALILIGVAAFEERGAIGRLDGLAIVAGCDAGEAVGERPIQEDAELHFAVTEDIRVWGEALAVAIDHILDDAVMVGVDKIQDLEGDVEVLGDGAGVLDILLPWAIAEDIRFVSPILHVGGGDTKALIDEARGRDGGINAAGEGDKHR